MRAALTLALSALLLGACTGLEPFGDEDGEPVAGSGPGGNAGSGGSPAGHNPGGTSSAGAGRGGSPASGAAGLPTAGNAGVSAGGSGGTGMGGSAGAAGSAGTAAGNTSQGGSAGACVQNLGCELDAPASTGDFHQDCVNRINQFRAECACLPPLARWAAGEACADEMAEYDSVADEAHAGFSDGICEGGNGQNECPGWDSETQVVDGCLQLMWDEGPPPQQPCNGQCFQDHGHFINMTNTRFTRVACGFYTTPSGDVWGVQNFSP